MKKINLIEWLWKTDSHEKQKPQRFARYAAMLIMLLTLGVGQMWAAPTEGSTWYDANAKVYFDNTNSNWSQVYILIGRQWDYSGVGSKGSTGVEMSKVSGTNNLYYVNLSWSKYTTFCFMNSNWAWEGNTVSHRCGWTTNTDTPNDDLSSGTHLYVPSSGDDNTSVTHTTPLSYTSLNYTQTLNQTLSTDGGSTFSTSTAAIATVKVQSKELNGNSSTTDASGTISSGSSSTSCAAARTATVTYTVSSVATGYEFVGWYDGSTQKSTSTTYFYNATEAKTITARFKETQYSLTFSHNGHGTIKVGGTTIASGSTANVNYHSTKTLVATPADGFHFTGWSLSGTNTGSVTIGDLTSSGNNTTIKATNTGATVTAGFAADQANYTLTFGVANSPANDGSLSVTAGGSAASSGTQYANNSAIVCTATPGTHSRVKGWYSDNGCATEIDGAGTGNSYSFSLGANTSVYVGFETATTAITLKKNNGSADRSVTATHGSVLPSFTAVSRTGYTLKGYYTTSSSGTKIINKDGTLVAGTSYSTSAPAKWNVKDRTLDLYAQWTANTYTIEYNANDAQYSSAPAATGSTANSSHTYGTSKALTSNGFKRAGYLFAGWATTPNGNVTYSDGQSVSNLSSTQGATVTLYAKWQAFDVHIKHPWDGGDWSWIQMEPQSDGTYTYTGFYGKNGVDLNTTESDSGKRWIQENNITGYGSVKKCQNVTFTYTPSALSDNNGKNGTMSVAAATPVVKTIHVKKGDGWDNITHIYAWNDAVFGGWPGSAINSAQDCSISSYLSSDQWVTIVLPSYLKGCDGFVLSNGQSDNSSGPIKYQTTDLTYADLEDNACYVLDNKDEDSNGSYYPQKTYKFTLTKIANCPTAPAVTLTIDRINVNQIAVIGTVTDYGNDGSSAAEMADVGFKIGSTTYDKDDVCFDGANFTKIITGLTANTTYSIKAYVTNVVSTVETSAQSAKTLTNATYKIQLQVPHGASTPHVYAWTDGDCNVALIQNAANFNSAPAMTQKFTATTYDWYEYDMDNKYEKFVFYTSSSSDQTEDFTANRESDCYWHNAAGGEGKSDRGGKLGACPVFTTNMAIKVGDVETLHEMSGSGTVTYTYNNMPAGTYSIKVVYNTEYYGKNSSSISRTGSTTSNAINDVVVNGEYITLNADLPGNYTFSFDESGKDLTVTYPTAYTITYGVGDVKGTSSVTVSPSFTSGAYVLPETDVTFTKGTTDNGYSWKGWYSNSNGSGTLHSDVDNNLSWTATRTGDISVYACYTINNYTITYNLNGGANPVSPAPVTSYTVETNTFSLPTPSKTGYIFAGWYENDDLSTGGVKTQIAKGSYGNKQYWAKWTPITFYVSFSANGGSGDAMSNQTFTYDAAQNLTANIYTKTGYNFDGWATAADGAKVYDDKESVSNLTNTNGTTVPLFAHWSPKTTTISFSQSGTGYGSGGESTTKTATYDAAMPTPITLPIAAQGYAFMGYYDEEDGEGTQYYNADGTSANNWDKEDAEATLYAYFKQAEITAITFDAAVVEASGTVSFAVTVSPTPVGDTKLCFTVLHSNDNPLAEQPTITYNDATGKYSFTAPEASGTYKVEAVLRTGSSCDGGTELDTEVASFQVAGIHNVTVQFKCGDEIIKASETVTGRPLDPTEITAPEIVGYAFSKWKAGDGITIEGADGNGEKASATINFTAIYDGKLTAVYTQKRMIYFYNTLNWENVYVYFYKNDSYWGASNQGTGANTTWTLTNTPYGEGLYGQMLPVEEGSKIYYFDAEEAGVNASYTNVAFTELDQHGCDYFYNNNKVVRRGDYHATTMPLFVPLSDQPEVKKNGNTASYYCEGYWMNYPANTGYTLRIYNTWNADNATGASREFMIPFSADTKMPLKQDVEINFSGKSWFIIYRNDGTYLEGSHTFKQTDHGDKKITSNADASEAKKMTLISDGSGIYTFTLTFRGDGGSPENYNYYLNVDFPAAVGDYRIIYKDNATWSNGAHGNDYATWYHPSDIIGKNSSETEAKEDTVSFFVSHGYSPAMKFQRISAINETTGAVTWTDVASGSITIPTSITASGVYNFIVTQPAGGASISLVKAEPYTGNYYIRTDCAGETKWNNFRSPDHLITYSEYSITHGGYSHYYAHWVQTDDKKNIKFCIANDYSSAISDTLTRESNAAAPWTNINNYIDEDGNILRNANVRFMWNQSTNVVSRAYVDGAQDDGSRFLVISSTDGKIKKADGSALSNDEVTFSDNENWIYEANVKAQPTSQFKLVSTWGTSNTITQYFKGDAENTETLIDGSGENWYDIRLLYDFKTNRLVAAWIPSDANITTDNAINADVMFIREHQGDIAQLTFGESGKISKIETAYGVIRFNKWTLANKEKTGEHSPLGSPASIYERSLFWISFPFRVKLSEVFGFGNYGEHWAIQYYDGAERAAKGHFAENGSFWKWMSRNTDYLEPNQGYLLAIDLDLLGESSDVWGPDSRSSQIELYFPSYGTMPDITDDNVEQEIPAHECKINWYATGPYATGQVPGEDTNNPKTSYNRTIYDSHWNVLSVPTYVNTDDVSFANPTWIAKVGPNFLYTWNESDNTITPTTASGYKYHAMHAYMVQYAGSITWAASSGSPYPAGIVARKTYEETPSKVELRLEIQQNEKMIDRTYVVMSNDENVSADFAFGEDMTKEFNTRKASIFNYTADHVGVAGNTMPMSEQTTIIPLGVEITQAGNYTFAIPDGTSGVGVTLVDLEKDERTNLALFDYNINLEAGDYNERFVLEISPIQPISQGIDEANGEGLEANGVRKVLIDNIMYIIRDGKVFDARGAIVK